MSTKSKYERHIFRHTRKLSPTFIFLLVLLTVAAATALALGEDLDAEAPDIDLEPLVMSRTISPDAVTTQVVIPTSADTYVASNKPYTNYGSSTWLRLGYNLDSPNNGAERILLKTDVSSIPSNAIINWARFRIYQHTVSPTGDSGMGVQSRHLSGSWSESTVTWNNHQADWGGVIGTSWPPGSPGWIEADVTQLVKEWVSGQHSNYGVTLLGDETVQERQRIFYSREFGGDYYPRLVVDYTVFVDNQPPQVSVEALPTYSPASFTVRWSGTDPGGSGIDYYDVQYRLAGQSWVNWLNNVTGTSAEFVGGGNGWQYEFRARGVDRAGNVQDWSSYAQASTTVDSIAPTATVTPLPEYIFEESYTVSWSGSDNLSGIKCYDIQVRVNTGPWEDWHQCIQSTSYLATGYQDNTTYELRARGQDNAGNVGAWPQYAQARTTVETSGPLAMVEPFVSPVTIDPHITVKWRGETSPGTAIAYFDVQYRFNNGNWIRWLSQVTYTSDIFVASQTGQYCFEARAKDTAGREEPFNYIPENCIVLDTDPPSIQKRLFVPFIYKDAFD